ncbi:MAG TPA: hemolysin family protein [Candidatus Thermoplasmatota archaeon]|nr:hemolysin family protein [Candidatus Thermoplasmatota archaeon]
MALPLWIAAAVLLGFMAASAFFSLSETAFIGVPRLQVRRLREAGDARAALVDRMLDEPERVLSTVLIGNNLVNIGATAFATVVAVGIFGSRGALIAAGGMAVLIILVSELLPKTFAVQKPLPLALAIARPLRIVEGVLKPLVVSGVWLTRVLTRPFGIRADRTAPFITTDEIEILVRTGVEEGHMKRFEHKVISGLFEFTGTDVQTLMTPRKRVHFLPKSALLRDAVEMAVQHNRTRILVVDGDFDHVLGFVHVKDLMRHSDRELAERPVTAVLRACLLAPHDLRADRLLRRMQREHKQLAVIQGPDGHNLGIATVEDLLEQLVGEMHDEFDAARPGHDDAPAEPTRAASPKT